MMTPPWEVMSPMRAAGMLPIMTVADPLMMLSGGPTQTAMSPILAAGRLPISTVGQPGGRIGVIGSATLVHALLDAGLVDEIQMLVHPIVLGKGVRLFAEGGQPSSMKLADSKILANGVVYLSYQIEHQA